MGHETSRQFSNSYANNNREIVGSGVLCGSAHRQYLENRIRVEVELEGRQSQSEEVLGPG
jgi:hypothetical protein